MTFLFTDIEGSTGLVQAAGPRWPDLLDRHRAIIRAAINEHSGTERGTEGDSFFVTFSNPSAAIAAATQAQRELVAEPWPNGLAVRVRMGLHLGEVDDTDEGPVGLAIHHAARIATAGHGAQIVLSDNVRTAAGSLPTGAAVIELGSYRVRDVGTVPIFQLAAAGLPRDFPPLRVPPEVPGNLPIELTTFIGRAAEVAALTEELAHHRMITLIGVGGTGKTRLAIETGISVSATFPDGCWIVELAKVMVPEAIPLAFADGLDITAPPEGDVIDHLVARLRGKRVLIVVDNCEHVLADAAAAIERIIAKCPTVAVLATSREPLMIRGERLAPVPSLSPDDAGRLFVERARDEAPDLQLDDVQHRAIIELCKRLDGLPLALELAASRVRSLSPVELVSALEERFRMLVGGRRSRMERHQTMRGTLDWSYDLCSPAEQAVFDRLSVFPAGFDLAAARAVASDDDVSELDVSDIVPQLLDRSLLQRTTAADGTTRYRMLETMRAYGREHLQAQGAADNVRGCHARYVAREVWSLQQRSLGPDELHALDRLDEIMPDGLVALDWCIDNREWELGLSVMWAGGESASRERDEMQSRLYDAARADHAPAHLLDELGQLDYREFLIVSIPDQSRRAWGTLRAKLPIPSNRFVFSPHDEITVDADHVAEFVASLDHWRSAPTITRFWAEYSAIRSLSLCVEADAVVDQLLQDFENFVRTLQSDRASHRVAHLKGYIAMQHKDWATAAKWLGQYKTARRGQLRTMNDLASTWHYLAARALDSKPFRLSGFELRDPWRFYREQHFEGFRWHGATATALALQRLGNDLLADRFATWAMRDTIGIMEPYGFAAKLKLAGLPNATIDQHDDLESLIDQLLVFADDLDANDQATRSSVGGPND
ncbi:MAG: NB-ARC domain-containing protein [Ilumatobacteraceae bacterium]